MKNFFSFLFLLAALSVNAQNMLVHYDFSSSYGNTVPDISGNGNNGTLFGGAHILKDVSGFGGFLQVGYTDSDYMSIPAEVLNGLTDFAIRIIVKTWFANTGSQTSMNTIFSASNASCINCFGLAYSSPDTEYQLSFNGVTYHLPPIFTNEIIIQRHGDTLFWIGFFTDTSLIVGNSPLDVSSFIVGQRAHCYEGCFKVKQALRGGLNSFKVWDYPKFKEADQFDSEEIFSLFPNPATTSFQINYSLTAASLLTITDAYGRIVKQLMLDPSTTYITISTDDLADGVYLVSFNDGGKRISQKLIVSR